MGRCFPATSAGTHKAKAVAGVYYRCPHLLVCLSTAWSVVEDDQLFLLVFRCSSPPPPFLQLVDLYLPQLRFKRRAYALSKPLYFAGILCSPVLLEKLSPSFERGNVVTILCLREKQMVAALSRLLEGKGLTIVVLETLVTRGVVTHALLLLFYDLLSFLHIEDKRGKFKIRNNSNLDITLCGTLGRCACGVKCGNYRWI